ncbi:hypothetical protein GCM10010394_52420 [Streptomyces crystallinus]|uniref:Uncharacterized protein n=1 Tax=Streptomyces crystallinus TaxID=68191 RepID=A0ABN1GPN6_9ACTN
MPHDRGSVPAASESVRPSRPDYGCRVDSIMGPSAAAPDSACRAVPPMQAVSGIAAGYVHVTPDPFESSSAA